MNINTNNGYVKVTTFSVSSENLSSFNVDWGDGTYSKTFPHLHEYSNAGDYTVRIIGCSSLSSTVLTEEVCVNSIILPSIEITTDPLSSYVGCGDTFEVCVSSLSPNITLHFYASGTNSNPYNEPEGFWDHLSPRWRFLDSDDNYISTASFSGTPITLSSETVAYSACYSFKYIDDMPGIPILFVTMETPNSNSRVYSGIPHSVSALEPNSLCITEDGIRPIYEIQWAGIPIPYVISFCNTDNECSTILHYTSGEILSSSFTSRCNWLDENISIYTISLFDENCFSTGGYVLTSLTLSSNLVQSVSTVIIPESCNVTGVYQLEEKRLPAQRAKISATATVTVSGGNTYTLSGESNEFTVYPFEEYHKFRRKGESDNLSDKLKYYAFTDRMRNFSKLWEYSDAIMGTDLASLGNRAMFGINKFVDQHSDLDRCNINSILDISDKLGVPVDDYNLDMPYEVRRILDIASIPLEKIVGTRCICNTNFANCDNCCGSNVCKLCGYDKKTNIGSLLTLTDNVTAGNNILYRENGSDVYEILYITEQGGESIYPLSELSSTNLVDKGLNNFCFYSWDSSYQGNPLESEIDYSSEHTTISKELTSVEDWYGDGGVIEELLNYAIIKGLNL